MKMFLFINMLLFLSNNIVIAQEQIVEISYQTPWNIEACFLVKVFSDGKVTYSSYHIEPIELKINDSDIDFDNIDITKNIESSDDDHKKILADMGIEEIKEEYMLNNQSLENLIRELNIHDFKRLKNNYELQIYDASTYKIKIKYIDGIKCVRVYALDSKNCNNDIQIFCDTWNSIVRNLCIQKKNIWLINKS